MGAGGLRGDVQGVGSERSRTCGAGPTVRRTRVHVAIPRSVRHNTGYG